MKLHEEAIASDTPFRMVAITNEIELLAVTAAPVIIGPLVQCLDKDIWNDLSFLQHHMVHDVDHADECQKEVTRIMRTYPNTARILCETGGRALEAYGEFLDDIYVLSSELVARASELPGVAKK